MQRLGAIIHGLHRNARQLRRTLRREGAAVALVALLSLGVLEPLACILHCDVFLPLVAASQHAHHQHGITFATPVDDASVLCLFGMSPSKIATLNAEPTLSALSVAAPPLCTMCQAQISDGVPTAPLSVAPLPFHEMAVILVVLLGALSLLLRQRTMPPNPPPRRCDPPLLQPPTLLLHAA